MSLLERDGISVKDVCDYHIYPIADNDTPRLSADRFEYTFSNALFLYGDFDLNDIYKFYNDIIILKNEDGQDELAFKTKEIGSEFLARTLPIFERYDSDNNRLVMQFFADTIKSMNVKGFITVNDLYEMSEEDVITLILNCEDEYIKGTFAKFLDANSIIAGDDKMNGKYSVSVKGKKRYIVPLVKMGDEAARISDVDEMSFGLVEDYKKVHRSKYVGFDFDFKPYEFENKKTLSK